MEPESQLDRNVEHAVSFFKNWHQQNTLILSVTIFKERNPSIKHLKMKIKFKK